MSLAVLAAVGVLALSACVTPTGAGTETPAPSGTAGESTPTPSHTGGSGEPQPTPTESATVVTPFNGEVLIVTSDVIDGRLEVTAMIPEVSEADGTCVLEVAGVAEAGSVPGNAGQGVTYCGVMSVAVPPGDVEFHVSYRSSTTQAESAVSRIGSAE